MYNERSHSVYSSQVYEVYSSSYGSEAFRPSFLVLVKNFLFAKTKCEYCMTLSCISHWKNHSFKQDASKIAVAFIYTLN